MGDLVIGLAKSVVEGALTKAQSAIEEEASLRQSAQRDLVFIAGEFEMMHSFLSVANDERAKNSVVRTWVRQVRDLAYDVEDCIELVVHLDGTPGWWRRFLPPCVDAATTPLDEAIAEIEQLKARVEDVSRRNSRYSLISDSGSKPALQPPPAPSDTAAAAAASATAQDMLVEARDAAKKQQGSVDLTQLIAKEEADLGVISVWGTGGDLGTTPIIRKAYQDPVTCRNFACRGWVKLTHPFSPHEFLRSLLAQFYTNSCLQQGAHVELEKLKGMEAAAATQSGLVEVFMKEVTQKRYLVVLENMCAMGDWDAIRTYLPDTKNGSLVIVSTQECEIASLCIGHPYQLLELKQYSAQHSVCVFFKQDSDQVNSEDTNNNVNEITSEDQASHCGVDPFWDRIPVSKRKEVRDWMKKVPPVSNQEIKENDYIDLCLAGRKIEMNELRAYLTSTRFDSDMHVVSVWGIAGVGKSALVRNLYYNRMLQSDAPFGKYGWVDICHPFSLRDFSRCLLSELLSDTTHQTIGTINDPIQECGNLLKEQRSLVVVDNLQSMEEWDMIRPVLVPKGSKSTIIVITTEASIALHCTDKKELVCNVRGLEMDSAKDLFNQEVARKNSPLKDLQAPVLDQLILKCGGLPKVLVAMAEYLAPKTVNAMDTVVSTNSRFMFELERNPGFESLQGLFSWMHSYFRTCPDFLKPCIFYLPIFPVNHSIRRRRLIRRWIAEGYARDTDESSAEERGEKFFTGLFDLSIIQQPSHSVTTTFKDRRMVLCQVNSFVREYIISRRMEENLVFELGGSCALTTQRAGRHLIIKEDWDRDRIVFDNIEFSRLRSFTVFGKWESFFISKSMRVLRVLDLEDTQDVRDDDLDQMLKKLPRLKFISLRKCKGICTLPSSLGGLRQLETLDVRHTSIDTLPATITKLKKMQYVRAGADVSTKAQESSPCSCTSVSRLCRSSKLDGVKVPRGIENMTALHTLGVVDVSSSGGKAILKEIKKLTQLRKLAVCGINRKNCKEFCSAISGYAHLESLSVRLSEDSEQFLKGFSSDSPPLKNLQSLKLYGLVDKLPEWIKVSHVKISGEKKLIIPLPNLTKLDLEMGMIAGDSIDELQYLESVCILRLSSKQECKLNFCVFVNGQPSRCYENVKVLELACSSSSVVTFGEITMQNVEILKVHCSGERNGGSSLKLSGLEKLAQLKEVHLTGYCDNILLQQVQSQLAHHQNGTVLKQE